MIAIVFWGSVLILTYTWIGYVFLLSIFSAIHRRFVTNSNNKVVGSSMLLSCSIIVAVHNEEKIIERKLKNCVELEYGQSDIETIVVSDGSTDRTVEIANEFASEHRSISVIELQQQIGKSLAQNKAVIESRGDIILFTDADTLLHKEFLLYAARYFQNSGVSLVAGNLIWTNSSFSSVTKGGDLYWRYEKMLWRLESPLGIMAWASGACMTVRKELFRPMLPEFGEDCIIPLDVVEQKSTVIYEPFAQAFEERISQGGAEFKARTRMTLRSFSGTLSKRRLLNPFRYPKIAWAIWSHKILRWLTPYFLIGAFSANLILTHLPFYRVTLAMQVLFYSFALVGYVADRVNRSIPLASACFAFVVANAAFLVGVAKALAGNQIVAYRSEG